MKLVITYLALIMSVQVLAQSESFTKSTVFQNIQEYKDNLGFNRYYHQEFKKPLKVAILDSSFDGYRSEVGRSLPDKTQFFAIQPRHFKESKGLRVAQLFTAMATDDLDLKSFDIELLLYSVVDDLSYKWSVQDLTERKVDLVLYVSEVAVSEKASIDWLSYSQEHGVFWILAVGEHLNAPANHPDAMTVGAVDSKKSYTSLLSAKPNILSPSLVEEEGEVFSKGSSNAAALVAAGAALIMATRPELPKTQISAEMTLSYDWSRRGLSLQSLRFRPLGPNCFWSDQGTRLPDYLQRFKDKGAQLVQTSAGLRFMIPFDPLFLVAEGSRRFIDDMITVSPQGFHIFQRFSQIPDGEVEVFQTPVEAGPCQWPGLYHSSFFKL